jgi:hypothetical protein
MYNSNYRQSHRLLISGKRLCKLHKFHIYLLKLHSNFPRYLSIRTSRHDVNSNRNVLAGSSHVWPVESARLTANKLVSLPLQQTMAYLFLSLPLHLSTISISFTSLLSLSSLTLSHIHHRAHGTPKSNYISIVNLKIRYSHQTAEVTLNGIY